MVHSHFMHGATSYDCWYRWLGPQCAHQLCILVGLTGSAHGEHVVMGDPATLSRDRHPRTVVTSESTSHHPQLRVPIAQSSRCAGW